MTSDRSELRGARWREFNDPEDRLVDLPEIPADTAAGEKTDAVTTILRNAVMERVFRQGEKMPLPRDMGNRFGCSSDTCRQAMNRITREGWLAYVRNVGYFVRGPQGR
jgi:DNA-binding GntR family transcriptional regulator